MSTPPPVDNDLMTPAEVARYLRVSTGTVYRWCDENLLTALRPGPEGRRQRVLIRRSEVEARLQFAAAQTAVATTGKEG